MMEHDELTEVRSARGGRRGRGGDPVLRAKLIFLGAAAAVLVLLIVSFGYAAKARSERNLLLQEVEALRKDNARLAQQLDKRDRQVESLRKQLLAKQGSLKTKPQNKKKTPAKKSSSSRKKPSTRNR